VFATQGVFWNTIQLGYYALVVGALFAARQLYAWLVRVPVAARWALGALALGVALPTSIDTLTLAKGGTVIDAREVAALHSLRDTTSPGDGVLISPFFRPGGRAADGYAPPGDATTTAYVAALSARPSYVAAPMSLDVMRVDYRSRMGDGFRLFSGQSPPALTEWMRANGIAATYPPQPGSPAQAP
jgi:hypothetical protein